MNEHDLHAALGDLARRGSADQAARMHEGTGLSAGDVTRRAARARQRRAGAVTVVAVVAGLVLGGSVLTHRPDPQPADTPAPTVTRPAPGPTRTPAPAPSATSAPDPDRVSQLAVVGPDGMLRAYPTTPQVRWTVAGAELRPPGDGLALLGDVTASMHTFGPFRALAAGDGWLLGAGDYGDERLVVVDSGTGAVRWSADSGADGVISCGGSHDGLLVCLGRPGTSATSEVQLRDPVSGAVVRALGPGGHGLAVVGDAALVFDSEAGDVRLRTLDLTTGAVRHETTLEDAVREDEPVGEGVVSWERAGSLVLVHGYQYNVAVDVSDGDVLGQLLDAPTAVRADGWVSGPAADGSLHAVGPHGEDLTLPGTSVATPTVWAPTAGLAVPLLVGTSPNDGEADRVTAVDPVSGATLWSVPGAWKADGVVGGTALLRGDGALVAVDIRTGVERWRSGMPGEVVGFDGTRVVLGGDDRAVTLDLDDGREVWSLPLTPELRIGQIDGTLVRVGPDGALSALMP